MLKKIGIFILIHLACLTLVEAKTIKVMIMDGPVDTGHPLLKDVKHAFPIKKTYPLKEGRFNNHGTHVTGLVVYGPMQYAGDNSDKLCDEIELISCQIFDSILYEEGFFRNQKRCIEYAIQNGIEYINMSYGGEGEKKEEEDLFNLLNDNGIKLIVASGNEGKNIDKHPYYPASYNKKFKNITVVGNVGLDGNFVKTSNYGDGVLRVRGEDVLSTAPYSGSGYMRMSGSSMSSAIHLHNILKNKCETMGMEASHGANKKRWPI